jgi:hypothetical protein
MGSLPPSAATETAHEPEPVVYGEGPIWVCSCYRAHGVGHLCALCRSTSVKQPTEPWVPAERCRTCLTDIAEELEAKLAVVMAKLRRAENAIDPISGERIPERFLTAKGWTE